MPHSLGAPTDPGHALVLPQPHLLDCIQDGLGEECRGEKVHAGVPRQQVPNAHFPKAQERAASGPISLSGLAAI